ncbi:MAG: hypothetical protein IJN49_02815 [Clostridia bacterium]|nr:hypothetical protein [Clostridia bacterium]
MLIKKHSPSLSAVSEVAVIVIFIIGVLPDLRNLLETLRNVGDNFLSTDVFKIMFKAFGVLTVGGIASDICRDNGENALAGVLEIVVKVLAISCAIPIFTAVLTTALSLLEQ